MFQSLTRDSNHSNKDAFTKSESVTGGFNPSRGIAIIQTRKSGESWLKALRFQSLTRDSNHSNVGVVGLQGEAGSFNPSRGIAIIQTWVWMFAAANLRCFNPSRGIAIIQTALQKVYALIHIWFQSLTRDSNHSNDFWRPFACPGIWSFNPSRGIAIIQTALGTGQGPSGGVSIPHAG